MEPLLRRSFAIYSIEKPRFPGLFYLLCFESFTVIATL